MVIWSEFAKGDLKENYDYIKKDSEFYAENFLDMVFDKIELIEKFPKMGRIVPEFDNDNIRELFVFKYRLIYELINDNIIIHAVIHGARDLTSEEFNYIN